MSATGNDAAIVDELCRWASAHFDGPVTLASPPTSNGAGFDSAIWFVELTGDVLPDRWRRRLVLRVKPDADRTAISHQEAAVHGWLVDRAFPAPRVLAVLDPGEVAGAPVQVMERAPGTMMLDAVLGAPWTAPAHVRRLAETHVRIHRLDPDGFPSAEDLLDKRLRLSLDTADAVDDPALRRAVDDVLAIATRLRAAPASVCHGDFHPLNVLVDGDDVTVIDWTDAGVGDRHGDVARTLVLFSVAAIAATSRAETLALRATGPLLGRRYRRSYERHLPLDPERLALWTPVHLLHGWSQAVGVAAGQFGDPARDAAYGELASALQTRFHRAIAAVR